MKWIRPVSILTILAIQLTLRAAPISTDSLQALLKAGEYEVVIKHLKNLPSSKTGTIVHPGNPENLVLLIIAMQATGDTVTSRALRQILLSQKQDKAAAQSVMKRLFTIGAGFFSKPDVYFFIQTMGETYAGIHQEPRAQFSFLQQQFSLYQMKGQVHETKKVLARMKIISQGHPYLEYLTQMQFGVYYAGLQHDSCTYYFDAFLKSAPEYVGMANPYFLNDPGYAAKKDSGMVASTIVEYAKHYIRKGDLKRAGELLITSDRHIPDTSTFHLLKIQNQLTLAMIYADLVHPEKATAYIDAAIALCDANKLTRLRQTRVASAKCYVMLANQQYETAFDEATLAYHNFKGGVNAMDTKKQALKAALCKLFAGQYQEGNMWLDSANTIVENHDQEIVFLHELVSAELATSRHSFVQAQTAYTKAITAAEKSHAIGWKKTAQYRAYLSAKRSHQPEKSLALLESFTELNDSLYRTGQDVALFEVQSAYEKTIQDETIARLDAEQESALIQLKAHRRIIALTLIGLLFVAGLCIGLYKMYRRLRLVNGQLSKTVQEKNILLREIHHRVKNNLQVISSLLKLQSGYIKDDSAIQAIAEGRSRVQSMALLHQNLYKEDNLTGVNMKEYFDNLIQGLFDTYNISDHRIVLHKNISALTLDVDTVVPLGLIANELISNALKHGFPDQSSGNLYVDLHEDDRQLVMKIRDDGTGLSISRENEGFGTKLIQSLSQKLEANITTRTVHGTEVILRIKDYKKAA